MIEASEEEAPAIITNGRGKGLFRQRAPVLSLRSGSRFLSVHGLTEVGGELYPNAVGELMQREGTGD